MTADATVHRIRRFDRQLALVIGINYERSKIQLENAEADADAMSSTLRARHGYDVIDIRGAQATRRQLMRLFAFCLRELVTENTQLLVYFAGHGLARDSAEHGLDGYLLPADATDEPRSWIPMHFIRRLLARLRSHHVLVILDCCFAGTFAPRYREISPETETPLYQEQYDHYLRRRAAVLLASSSYDERALDRLLKQRAPFTSTLVGALGETPTTGRDNIVTATQLYSQLRKALGTTAGVEQTPNLWPLEDHDAGEYVFALGDPTLPPAPPLTAKSNPYRGLRYFGKDDAAVFKGRTSVVAALVRRASTMSCVVLLGPSGSGKSSVLHAGLAVTLKEAAVLGPVRLGAESFARLVRAAINAAPANGRRTSVILDQLDELVALPADERGVLQALFALLVPGAHVERTRALLLTWSKMLSGGVWDHLWAVAVGFDQLRGQGSVVFGLRSDVEPHFVQRDTIGELLSETWKAGRTLLPPMTREELRECIVGPAAERVVFFSSAPPPTPRPDGKDKLVEVILDEIEQMPDALPLLSVALERMFESFYKRRAPDRVIDWSDYPERGGIVGALQDKAQQLYSRGAPEHESALEGAALAAFQETCRRLLLYLVSWRGTTPVRHPVARTELAWRDDEETQRAARVLDLLINERLVVTSTDHVQLVHDALITSWPELWRWLQTERQRLLLHDGLREAVRDWVASKQDDDHLWSDARVGRLADLPLAPPTTRLARVQRWLWRRGVGLYPLSLAPPHELTATEHAFVDASLRARRRRRTMIAGISLGVIAALGTAAAITYRQREAARDAETAQAIARQNAEDEATRANDRVKLRAAKPLLESDTTTAAAILAEVAKPALAPGWSDDVRAVLDAGPAYQTIDVPEAAALNHISVHGRTALLGGPTQTVVWRLDPNTSYTIPGTVVTSPDASRAAAKQPNRPLDVWDVAAGQRIASAPDASYDRAEFSPEGSHLLTTARDPSLAPILWNAGTGSRVAALDGCGAEARFATASRVITWAFGGDHVCVWDTSTGADIVTIDAPRSEVVVSPRGDRFVTMRSMREFPTDVHLRNAADGREVAVLPVQARTSDEPSGAGIPSSSDVISFSPEGSRILISERDRFSLWDTGSGKARGFVRRTQWMTAEWAPDGKHLIVRVPGFDRDDPFTNAAIIDAATASLVAKLEDGLTVDWSPRGDRVTIADENESRLVNVSTGAVIVRAPVVVQGALRWPPTFSPDGSKLLELAADHHSIAIVDARAGTVIARITDDITSATTRFRFSSDGAFVVADRPNRIWSTDTGHPLAAIANPTTLRVFELVGDRDHTMITIGASAAYLWKTSDFMRTEGELFLSENARIAAIRTRSAIAIRNADDWSIIGTYAVNGDDAVVYPSPEGRWVALVEPDRVQIIDAMDGSARTIAGCGSTRYDTRVEWAAARVAIAATKRTGCLVDLAKRERVLDLPALRWFLLSSRGDRIVLAPSQGSSELRDAATGRVLRTFPAASDAAAFSADGAWLAIDDGGGIAVCDATAATCSRVEDGPSDATSFTPDTSRLLTRSRDGTFRLRDRTGTLIKALGRISYCGDDCATMRLPDLQPVQAFSFSDAPPRVGIPELVSMWDTTDGSERPLKCPEPLSVTPRMRFVRGLLLAGLCVVDASTGAFVTRYEMRGPPSANQSLLSARNLQSGKYGIYDLARRLVVQERDQPVEAFSRDGSMFVEAVHGHSVYHLGDYAPIARLPVSGIGWKPPTFSEHGQRLIYADSQGVHAPPLGLSELAERLAHATTYCLTVDQRRELLEEPEMRARLRSAACLAVRARERGVTP